MLHLCFQASAIRGMIQVDNRDSHHQHHHPFSSLQTTTSHSWKWRRRSISLFCAWMVSL
jgi:hypothetical protein